MISGWAVLLLLLAILSFGAVVFKAPQHWWLPLGLALFVAGFLVQLLWGSTAPVQVHW